MSAIVVAFPLLRSAPYKAGWIAGEKFGATGRLTPHHGHPAGSYSQRAYESGFHAGAAAAKAVRS